MWTRDYIECGVEGEGKKTQVRIKNSTGGAVTRVFCYCNARAAQHLHQKPLGEIWRWLLSYPDKTRSPTNSSDHGTLVGRVCCTYMLGPRVLRLTVEPRDAQIAIDFNSNPLATWNRTKTLRFHLRFLTSFPQIERRFGCDFAELSAIANRFDITQGTTKDPEVEVQDVSKDQSRTIHPSLIARNMLKLVKQMFWSFRALEESSLADLWWLLEPSTSGSLVLS